MVTFCSRVLRPKCIIILSTKSAGSSALQRRLIELANAKTVTYTRHFENETLYWTKAASVLGLPQISLPRSEVPLPAVVARHELITLLKDNVPDFSIPDEDGQLIYGGWHALCATYSPLFLEKSPHHLYQKSALVLMAGIKKAFPEIDTFFVGLVRNPMDTLYSSWKRFGVPPEKEEPAWRAAYRNLIEFQAEVPDRVLVVRYEDVVRSDAPLRPLEDFLRCRFSAGGAGVQMHDRSLQKWRNDDSFGFQLDPETAELAASFDYGLAGVSNVPRRLWPVRSRLRSVAYEISDRLPNNAARLVKALIRRVA